MNIFTISIVEIIMRVYTRVRFFCLESVMNRNNTLKVFDENRCLTKPVKEFILSKVVGLQPATLIKNEFFRRHFSRVLTIFVEQIFCRAPFNGCFCMEKL